MAFAEPIEYTPKQDQLHKLNIHLFHVWIFNILPFSDVVSCIVNVDENLAHVILG
jgi:hypothetical protein